MDSPVAVPSCTCRCRNARTTRSKCNHACCKIIPSPDPVGPADGKDGEFDLSTPAKRIALGRSMARLTPREKRNLLEDLDSSGADLAGNSSQLTGMASILAAQSMAKQGLQQILGEFVIPFDRCSFLAPVRQPAQQG